MNDNYDRHDFLRIAVPGYLFLLVVGAYWLVYKGSIAGFNGVNWEHLVGILAGGFPLGFVIQAVYLSWHISSGDLEQLDGWEGCVLRNELKANNKEDLVEKIYNKDSEASEGRQLSWFLETYLFLQDEKQYRQRSHELVSRIHSFGAGSFAIFFGVGLSLILIVHKFCFCFLVWSPYRVSFLLITLFWIVVMACFVTVRDHTKMVFGLMSRNFIKQRLNKIITYIDNKENSQNQEGKSP